MRRDFEAWISAPPFELSVRRRSLDPKRTGWPGSYIERETWIAWEAWQEAAARYGQREGGGDGRG